MNGWILHRARARNVRKKEGRPLGRPSQILHTEAPYFFFLPFCLHGCENDADLVVPSWNVVVSV
jgi:hypothetical protein